MTCQRADPDAPGNLPALQVESDDLAALRVADEGVAAVRMSRRVARLPEAPQHAGDTEGSGVDERDEPQL